MIGRLLLAGVACTLLAAEPEQEITNVISKLASALSHGEHQVFLDALDHKMPEYQQIEHDVTALAADTDLDCTIELIRNTGNDTEQTADLDWYMVLRSQQDQNLIERRRAKVAIKVTRRGKKWIVTGFSPVEVFRPLSAR